MIQSLLYYFQNLSKKQQYWLISGLCYLSTLFVIFFIFDLIPKEVRDSHSFEDVVLKYKPKEIVFSVDKDFITFSS
ncbi:MAG: hypothetical protein ACRCTJ_05520, partial [Brevinema sp.]